MKNNVLEITEDALIVMGVVVSVEQIETILGIVLLSFQILLILFKSGKLIYNKIKNKDYEGAVEDAKKVVDDVNKEIKKYGDRKDTK